MRSKFAWILVLTILAGGWYFLSNFRIDGLESLRLVPRAPKTHLTSAELPVQRSGDTIRVATFNIQVIGNTKLDKPHVLEYLARICRQFDVVALQDIRSADEDVLPRLIEAINRADRQYDYAIGPRLPYDATPGQAHQYAFVFDQASIEIDRLQLYTIDDPDDLLVYEPLVGWFRVRGLPEDQGFTFTLVNLKLDAEQAADELRQLEQIYRVVVNDGRGEDDVILLGNFRYGANQLEDFRRVGLQPAIRGVPTDTRGTSELDNMLLHDHATTEFVGRSGVFDFMREYNLTLDQALEVADHLPVWAEFSIMEGGRAALSMRRAAHH